MENEQLIPLLAAALGTAPECTENIRVAACLPLAQAHSVANMLFYALPRLSQAQQPAPAERQVLKRLAFAAASREAIQQKELDALLTRFEEKRITVLPLKGSVLKQLYPKPELRYLSDIDLLFDAAQAQVVKATLEHLGYSCERFGQGDADIYLSPNRMKYELHRTVRNEGFSESCRCFLETLLSRAKPQEGRAFVSELPYEVHYAYLLCHFAKHLLYGGIGVRQVMDIYLCRKQWHFDEEALSILLQQLDLSAFAETLERLAGAWFGGGSGNAVTRELGVYVLGSGSFGTEEQRVIDCMLRRQKKTNRLCYALRRIFPPYNTMCFYFPILKKVAFLLPFYWIFRIFRGVFCKRQKLSAEVGAVLDATDGKLRERAAFYRRCGLRGFEKNETGEKV